MWLIRIIRAILSLAVALLVVMVIVNHANSHELERDAMSHAVFSTQLTVSVNAGMDNVRR